MRNSLLIFVVRLLACIQAAPTNMETVWLKDMTESFQSDKRTISGLNLPAQLTFHLRRGSYAPLKLHLKRNYNINSNPGVYFARKLKDGRTVLVKEQNLEKEEVAYYQDKENDAFMTVRCVQRSKTPCERVINGNIQIGDNIYDIRPADNDVVSNNLLEVVGPLGERYILQNQAHIQRRISFEKKAVTNVDASRVEQELTALHGHFEGNLKQIRSRQSGFTLPSRHNKGETVNPRQLKVEYNVKVAVLIDPGLWRLYSSMVAPLNPIARRGLVKRKITEAFSHIMNGVSMRYKGIEDPSISINVFLSDFIFFERNRDFPHKSSKVMVHNGTKFIETISYLEDLAIWDLETGQNHLPFYDQAMLFTSYNLYKDSLSDVDSHGASYTEGVCEIAARTSVIQAVDYIWTVWATAHELGHSLGADHDGEKKGITCKAEDLYIMTPSVPYIYRGWPYSRNPWMFSNCSVEAFKQTLKDKDCVKTKGYFFNAADYNAIVTKKPGETSTHNEQCHAIKGPKSVLCETAAADICLLMRCTDPATGICLEDYYGAASGTTCGDNMAIRRSLQHSSI